MYENKRWYVVYTRPKCEKKVAEAFTKRKIENYYPINKIGHPDLSRTINEPLFNCYVFVRVHEKQLDSIKQMHGVISFVYWLGKPVTVHNSEIESIRQFLNEHKTVKLEKIDININYATRVSDNQPRESEAYIFNEKNDRAQLVLPSLGYLVVAETGTINHEQSVNPILQWIRKPNKISLALKDLS
jgi:transcription antitermination factor NusG